jgi:hypothetical protein
MQAVAAGTCAAAGIAGSESSAAAADAHPNLLYVFPDQMRGQALGFLGQEPVLTPTLDRFSRECAVFTHAASNYPLCSPYRGMLWTGKYPFSTGVTENSTSTARSFGCELKADEICLSDILKKRGYSLGQGLLRAESGTGRIGGYKRKVGAGLLPPHGSIRPVDRKQAISFWMKKE